MFLFNNKELPMFKHKFLAIGFCLSVLGFSPQNAHAMDPSTLSEELTYYLKRERPSENFYSNITEGRDEKTKETILKLQEEERRSTYWSNQEKQEASKAWFDLSEENERDEYSSMLYLSKVLEIKWNGEVAIKLADKCHQLAQFKYNPEDKFILAYRGFANLRVNLTEPDYDYHLKLRAAPQVINLLEDLKTATISIKSLKDLSFWISPKIFPEHCLPQAQVCSLLMVAYSADILLGLDNVSSAQSNIFNNGKEALELYKTGLQGQTTPDQRQYYHKQIVSLVCGINERTPDLFRNIDKPSMKLMKSSALELARTYKDAYKESQGLEACHLAYKTALSYAYAGKNDKALKYIEIVSAFPAEESERGIYADRIKILAENQRLQIQGSVEEVFCHQLKNLELFWR